MKNKLTDNNRQFEITFLLFTLGYTVFIYGVFFLFWETLLMFA